MDLEGAHVPRPDRVWTIEEVAAWFHEAALTSHRLPPARVMGYFNSWPPIKRESWEVLAAAEPLQRPIPPSPEQVDRMLEAMHCIQCLEVEQRHLVWMRAEGYRWRDIASRFGCNRTTAWRRWQSALQTVLQGLHTGALHPKIVSNVG